MTVSFTQYVRDRKNRRRGVFLVDLDGDQVSLGWSLCSITRGDHFDRDFGLQIAEDRRDKREALSFSLNNRTDLLDARQEVPHSMRPTFDRIIDRCGRIVRNQEAEAVA